MTRADKMKQRWQDPEFRQRMKAAISDGLRKRWTDPAYREAQSAANSVAKKGARFSPEHRAKISAAKKGKPLSAAHRAAISAAMTRVMEDEHEREKRGRR